jgi:hypothetical protein
MLFIEQIVALFGATPLILKGEETFRDFAWLVTVSPWRLPTTAALREALSRIPSRDGVQFTARIDNGTGIPLNSMAELQTQEFLQNLTTYYTLEHGQNTLEIDLRITKHIENDSLSLYSLSYFVTSVQKLNAKQLFATFEPVCSGTKRCYILLPQIIDGFETETLIFTHASLPTSPAIKRDELILARKDVCHFEGSQRRFLPEDFRLKLRSSSNILNDLFDRLCLIATLAFLSDVSSLTDEGIFAFKLNGYRAIIGEVNSQIVSTALLDELFKVYRWAYLDGSTSDKLGLARNIISLHCKGDVTIAPDPGIYESILSGYALYLKEHVDEYISLKKSLCDYLSEFSQKSAALADSVGEKLERNFVAFVGFFISTILLKLVTEKDLIGWFPKPLQIIAWGLIAASLLHGVVSFWFSIRERKRVVEDFNLLRIRYSDLLHKSDLDRVLNEDQGFRKTIGHLNFKLRLLFICWLGMLIICSVVVVSLSRTLPATQGVPSTINSPAQLLISTNNMNSPHVLSPSTINSLPTNPPSATTNPRP